MIYNNNGISIDSAGVIHMNFSASEWERYYGKKFEQREKAAFGRRWGRGPFNVGDVCQFRGDYRLYAHKICRIHKIHVVDGITVANVSFLGPAEISRTPSPVDEKGFSDRVACYNVPLCELRRI